MHIMKKLLLALALVSLFAAPLALAEDDYEEPIDEKLFRDGLAHTHAMEEARKEESVYGVTGSPYIINEVFIGYRNYDMWLYNGNGVKINFRQSLSLNADRTIGLTLQATSAQPSGLRLRTDNTILYHFDHIGFGSITLKNADGSIYANLRMDELRDIYKNYDLMPFEMISVGDESDPVEKLSAQGQFVPVGEGF